MVMSENRSVKKPLSLAAQKFKGFRGFRTQRDSKEDSKLRDVMGTEPALFWHLQQQCLPTVTE